MSDGVVEATCYKPKQSKKKFRKNEKEMRKEVSDDTQFYFLLCIMSISSFLGSGLCTRLWG